ncbi:MAG: hypothetical protein RMI89_01630 [Gloeomargarita sp. SKYBB_i_bin120]|nr:hypothetical protein [Gloeomargarita sp. SKYB120]MDW8177222.1 hypothetical protein [Gloeomargarita sp. SKYBB_i_bin120]
MRKGQWLAILSSVAVIAGCQPQVVEVKDGFETVTLPGQAGGPVDSEICGYIAQRPNHELHLPQAIDYLKIQVNSAAPVTLFIQGPDGSFCATAIQDRPPQIAGYWLAGRYQVFVGTPATEISAPYELVITDEP